MYGGDPTGMSRTWEDRGRIDLASKEPVPRIIITKEEAITASI